MPPSLRAALPVLALLATPAGAEQAAQAPPQPACAAGKMAPVRVPKSEHLAFKVDVLGASIGVLEIDTRRPEGADKKPGALLIESRGRSTDLVNTNFRRFEGWTSVIVSDKGDPSRYREEVDDGDRHFSVDVRFPPAAGRIPIQASTNGDPNKVELSASPEVRDVLSGLAVLRQQPLKPGQSLCAEVYASRRMWRVEGTVAAEPETIETPLGAIKALRIDALSTRLDDEKITRKAHLWISADERRLPLAILGEAKGRFIRATLVEARQGRRSARAER